MPVSNMHSGRTSEIHKFNVNTIKFHKFLKESFDKVYKEVKTCLESKFPFGSNNLPEFYDEATIKFCINSVINEKLGRFWKTFLANEFSPEITNDLKTDWELALRSRLERLGAKLETKNFLASKARKCIAVYEAKMKLFLRENSTFEITKIHEQHEILKQDSLQLLEKEVGSCGNESLNGPIFVNLDEAISKVFSKLVDARYDATIKMCMEKVGEVEAKMRESITQIFIDCGIPFEEKSIDVLEICSKVQEIIQKKMPSSRIDPPNPLRNRMEVVEGIGEVPNRDVDVHRRQTDTSVASSPIINQAVLRKCAFPKWTLKPVPTHNLESVLSEGPTGNSRNGKKRGKETERNFQESLRTFGIQITPTGIRVGITVNSVPHLLVEKDAINKTGVSSEESSTPPIIPLLVGKTNLGKFVIGKEAERNINLAFSCDVAELFRNRENHTTLAESTVTVAQDERFQLELLLAIIFFKVKVATENALRTAYGRNVVNILKLVITCPPHLKAFQIQQIRDAALIADFTPEYVAILNEATAASFDFSTRFFKCNTEQAEANLLVICQYRDGADTIVAMYSAKFWKKLSKTSIQQFGHQELPENSKYVMRISNAGVPSLSYVFKVAKSTIVSGIKISTHYCDSSLPRLVQIYCEHPEWKDFLTDQAHQMGWSTEYICDEYAPIRGLLNLGIYGYWFVNRQTKKKGSLEVQILDSCVNYTSNKDVPFDPKNLNEEQCNQCSIRRIQYFGNSRNRGGKQSAKRSSEVLILGNCQSEGTHHEEESESETKRRSVALGNN